MMKYFIVTKVVAKNGIFSENKDSPLILIFCKKLPKVAHIAWNKMKILTKILILNKVPT